jgi:HK97 family phage portal protein
VGLLGKAFRAHPANITNPSLYGFAPEYSSYTGTNVDEEKSLYFPAIWRAVSLVAGTVASLPLYLNKRMERGREPAKDHPLFYMMHRQPNSKMTSMTFREAQMCHLLLWGNCYAEMDIRGPGGEVKGLYPLYPGKVEIETIDGEYVYLYHRNDGKTIPFPAWKILHIRGMSPDGLIQSD